MDAQIIRKLQLALKNKGYIISISTNQFYSDSADRWIKIYIVRHGKEELIRTPSQLRIIKHLAAILSALDQYKGGNRGGLNEYIRETIIKTEKELEEYGKKKKKA